MNATTHAATQAAKRNPIKHKLHVVTDVFTGNVYLVRAKSNAGAINAVSTRYTSRKATADDIDAMRDVEIIEFSGVMETTDTEEALEMLGPDDIGLVVHLR